MGTISFQRGNVLCLDDKELQVNDLQIFRRFYTVIGLTYRGPRPAKKPKLKQEKHDRSSFGKVRSRTMGMQKSEELKDVIRVVYETICSFKYSC